MNTDNQNLAAANNNANHNSIIMKTNNYIKYADENGQPVKNLWQRNEKLYAQISLDGKSARFPLEARTAAEAIIEVAKIKQELCAGLRSFPGYCPQPAVDMVKPGGLFA